MACAMLAPTLLRLKVSEAAAMTATLCAPASYAASKPLRLGTSAGKTTPGACGTHDMTSLALSICGTRFGLTKAAASTADTPVRDRRSMKLMRCVGDRYVGSFWRPSRAPTS